MGNDAFNSGLVLWTFCLLFVVVFVTAIWAFVYWWKKARHTRERFAFFGATALMGLISLLVMQLATNASIVTVVVAVLIAVIKKVGGLADLLGIAGYSYQPKPLSPFETVIYMIVIFGLGGWFYKVFRHWDGQKSKAQYEQEQNRIPPSVLSDLLLLLAQSEDKRAKLAPYQEAADPQHSVLEGVEDTRAWHEQARQLWLLHRRHYLFQDDYDSFHKCWWGKDKRTGALACLACYFDMPSETDIATMADYMRQIPHAACRKQQMTNEIILACKNGDFASTDEPRDGYALHRTNQSELLNSLVDFSDYFGDIQYRVERATLPDSDLTLEKTYTPSRYRLAHSEITEHDTLESFIQEWLTEKSTRQLALLGEYGQGKSTISLVLSYNLIKLARENIQTRVPVLIELRGKSPRSLTPEELLATWAYRYRIEVQALMQLLMAGRLVLIFEGFDEMDLTGDTDTRLNHFRTLWRLSYPEAKILITGRPNFFLDDSERKRALGIEAPHIFLAPFRIEQIEDSLRSVDAETRKEIIELSKQDEKFYEIVARPSLLFIVSTLWKREKLSERRGQISSVLVMELFIRHSYRRQGAKQAERNFMALNSAERAYFMTGIAAYMAVQALPNQISQHQLDAAIIRLVESIPDDVSRSVGAVANETRHPLKKSHPDRFDWEHNQTEVLEHIKTDVRACGILVTDFSKDGAFKFAHKSFMEFLQAQVVSQLFVDDETSRRSAASIVNALNLGISNLDSSPETMTFLAELLREHVQAADINKKDEAVAGTLFNIFVLANLNQHGFGMHMRNLFVRANLWLCNQLPWILNRIGLRRMLALSHAFIPVVIFAIPIVIALGLFRNTYGVERGSTTLNMITVTTMMTIMTMFLTVTMARGISTAERNILGAVRRLEMWFQVCRNFGLSKESIASYAGRNLVARLESEYSSSREEKLVAHR